MKRRAQLLVAIVGACARATARRLRHGPTLPSWTWSEEWFTAGFRAFARTDAHYLGRSVHRGGMKPPLPRGIKHQVRLEMTQLGGVPVLQIDPVEPALGTILYFHGGGFVTGSAVTERGPAAHNAVATRSRVYSLEYRLAPAHPYPAALDDAIGAYRSALDQGVDPATTVLFGGSAGAGLALSTLLEIRELGLPRPAGAVLLWPYADFTYSGASIDTYAEIDMLPLRDLAHVWGPAYVGTADPADPRVSPALADLSGLPPLLVIAGGAESLLSCAEQIADHARAGGVDVQFTVYPEKVHGWMILPMLEETKAAESEVHTWVRARIAAAQSD